MPLYSYMQQTQELLSDIKQEIVNPAFLAKFINTARGQLAGESECIRILGTITTALAVRNYNFTAISTGISATNGVQGILNVRSILYSVAYGMKWLRPRPWEWFQLFKMNNPVPPSGAPQVWSQYGQGSTGSFYLDPIPNLIYTLTCDAVCFPIALVDDNTFEAIPYPWTDAVPYFSAYLAYLSVQRPDRAKAMLDLYSIFSERARRFSNPSVNRSQYEQERDPVMLNKIGLQQKSAGGG